MRSRLLTRRIAFALGGLALTYALIHVVKFDLLPVKYLETGWHYHLDSVCGFLGALVGAWGLKHGWWGWIYGIALGLLHGTGLFVSHGGWVLYVYPGGCGPMGSRSAGVAFFVLCVVGGYVGTRLAGKQVAFLSGHVIPRRVGVWALSLGAVVAYWLVLYYFDERVPSFFYGL